MPRSTRRTFLKGSTAAGLAGIGALSGCLGSLGGGSTQTLKLGWIAPGSMPSPFGVPEIQDMLDNYGDAYEVEMSQVQSTPSGMNKVAAGELDTATSAYSSFPSALSKNVTSSGLVMIGAIGYDAHKDWFKIPWLGLEDSGLKSSKDLKGKKVGLNGLGTGVHAIAEKEFQRVGIDSDSEIEYVEIPFPAMGSAIREGKVAAGTVPPAFAAQIRGKGGVRTVFDSRDAWGSAYPFSGNVTTADNLESKSDAFKAWGEDYGQLIRYLQNPENRSEYLPWFSDHFGLPKALFASFAYQQGKDWYLPEDGRVDKDRLQEVVDTLPEIGFLDEAPDVKSHIRNDILG